MLFEAVCANLHRSSHLNKFCVFFFHPGETEGLKSQDEKIQVCMETFRVCNVCMWENTEITLYTVYSVYRPSK